MPPDNPSAGHERFCGSSFASRGRTALPLDWLLPAGGGPDNQQLYVMPVKPAQAQRLNPQHGGQVGRPCRQTLRVPGLRAPVPAAMRYPSDPPAASNHRRSQITGRIEIKEVTMTRRIRLWITAVLGIAGTGLMVGLTVAAQAGVSHAHAHPPLAGVTFNGID